MSFKTKKSKRIVLLITILVMVFTGYTGSVISAHAASAKTTAMYNKRAKIAKKNLKKKVLKMLKKGYASLYNVKRKGKIMTCDLSGSIGEGAYMMSARVNLKTGKVKINDNMVSIKSSFKISVKK